MYQYSLSWEENESIEYGCGEKQLSPKTKGLYKTKVKRRNLRSSQATERRKWSPEEDDQLVKLIKKYGTKNWRVVASHLRDRTPKQCRERWINHLDPAIIKGKLTEEEWNIVLGSQEELGNRWSEIAKLLPGRTPNQIKNVWHAMMRRETKQRKPKRKVSMISTLNPTGETREGDLNESESEEVSESEEWEPLLKKRKLDVVPGEEHVLLSSQDVLLQDTLSQDVLLQDISSQEISSQEVSSQEISPSPSTVEENCELDNPYFRLQALVEIASDLYKLEKVQEQPGDFEQSFSDDEDVENDDEGEEDLDSGDADDLSDSSSGPMISENSGEFSKRYLRDLLNTTDDIVSQFAPVVESCPLQTHWQVLQV